MQKYIDQLLEDLKAAERPEQPWTSDNTDENGSIEAHFAEVERYLEMDPEHTFSYHCGIQKEVFPPAERLTSEQMAQLIQGLKQMLFSYNLTADMPEGLEIEKAYALMVGVLDEKVDPVSSGFIGIEFCNSDVVTCPFGSIVCAGSMTAVMRAKQINYNYGNINSDALVSLAAVIAWRSSL